MFRKDNERVEGLSVTSPFLISGEVGENTDVHDGRAYSGGEAGNGSNAHQRRNGSGVCKDKGITTGPNGGCVSVGARQLQEALLRKKAGQGSHTFLGNTSKDNPSRQGA